MNGPSRAHAWRGYIGLSLVWLVVLGIALFVSRQPASQPIEILPPPTLPPTLTPLPSPTPGPLRVDVAGAVRRPGVYTLPVTSIIADAIAAAGGPSNDADLDRVNKAVPLSDGMQVYVPHEAETAAPQPVTPIPAKAVAVQLTETGAVGASGGGALVDINTATLAELDTLPGVGPATAQRIVDGRPYGAIADLMRVKGIGQATFDKLKERITVK
jgi:competence protein ComEA